MTVTDRYAVPSAALANYDFADIISGTGFIVLFGSEVNGEYVLSNNETYSRLITTQGTEDGSEFTEITSKNFDIPVKRHIVASGDAIINIPVAILAKSGGGSVINDVRVDPYLAFVRNSVETVFAQASGAEFRTDAGGAPNVPAYFIDNIKIADIEQVLNKGDTLRLKVKLYGKDSDGATSKFAFAHDPKNRSSATGQFITGTTTPFDFGSVPTVLSAQIPVRVEV